MIATAAWLAIAFAAAEVGQRWWPLHTGAAMLLPVAWLLLTSRSGRFGCLWPAASAAAWRDVAAWPQQAALLAMLPMMAALPALADACRAGGLSPAALLALHAAAMLLPPLLLPSSPWLVAALLAAGGGALLALPGLQGLTITMLLHGAAWGLARTAPRAAAAAPIAGMALPVLVLLGVAFALAQAGPAALLAVHGALALCGVAGLVAMARRHNPAHHGRATHRHP